MNTIITSTTYPVVTENVRSNMDGNINRYISMLAKLDVAWDLFFSFRDYSVKEKITLQPHVKTKCQI